MKKVMILGASELQIPIIIKAKDMGHYVIGVDMNPQAKGFKFCDEKLIISTLDFEAVYKEAKNKKIDAILTAASDQPMNVVAKVSEKLCLKSISVEVAESTTNKYLMREKLKKNNIAIPKYYMVNSYENFIESLKKINTDCIVKPVDSSGSRGVFFCNLKSNDLKEIYNNAMDLSRTEILIVEEFMKGNEVSVESFTIDGNTEIIAITDKVTTGSPNFVELSHAQPTNLNEKIQKDVHKLTKKTIKALGIENGPSHTEIMITKEGAKVIEIGARLGGDNITSDLVPLSTGVDMLRATIELSLGIIPVFKKYRKKYSKIIYLTTDPGIVKSIKKLEEIKKIKNVHEVNIKIKVGDTINTLTNSSDRIGYIILSSHCKESLEKSIDKVIRLLEIDIKKSD